MDILLDNLTPFVGEFTLTEYKNGSSEILVQEKNMIMNRAKQSLAEMLSGAKMGEVGNAYNIQPINRFELGSGSHTGLVKIDPVNTLTKLRALTNQALGGALTTDNDKQLYRIDFDPFQTGVTNFGGPNGTTLTTINNAAIKEFDNSNIFKASGTPTPLVTGADPSVVKIAFETATDASGTYKTALLYEITIPELRANQASGTFNPTNPVYYSEAGLFVRKGDLDTTLCNYDVFAIKTFPPRPKASDSKWVISWKIIF